MSIQDLTTVIIPARNEIYLQKTIQSLLENSIGPIEILAVLDGYWESSDNIVDEKRVNYLHFTQSKGMRDAINDAVNLAKGTYILKTDAHCLFAPGYDVELKKHCGEHTVVVPRRHRLDPERWEIIRDGRPPVDYEYLAFPDSSRGLFGVRWEEKAIERKDIMVDDLLSSQGSCWMMRKSHYEFMDGLEVDKFGRFFLEFQEISLKTWLSGGTVLIDKNTYYAHWHKTEGRGYSMGKDERKKAVDFINLWIRGYRWHKQTNDFEWLINKFSPMPGWEGKRVLWET